MHILIDIAGLILIGDSKFLRNVMLSFCAHARVRPQECRPTDASRQRDGSRRGRLPPVRRLHQSLRGRRRNRPSPAGRQPCSISPGCRSVHLIYGMQLEVSSAKVQALFFGFPRAASPSASLVVVL